MVINNWNSHWEDIKQGRSLRILGLSDPDRAAKKIKKSFGYGEHVRNLCSRLHDNALNVLWWESPIVVSKFTSTLALIPTGTFLKSHDLEYDGKEIFEQSYGWWYSFRHFFLKSPQTKKTYMACAEVCQVVIIKTQKELGDEIFWKLEKSLWLLMSIMNHDTTTHRYGLISWIDSTGWNAIFNYLWFDQSEKSMFRRLPYINNGEFAAAAFHRDIFEELDKMGLPLKKTIIKNTLKFLEIVSHIWDERLRSYWINVMKYPLFSLLDPQWKEVQSIRDQFPEFPLKPTRWWKVVHRKYNNCKISLSSEETIQVSLREIRKIMMSHYQTQTPGVAIPLAKLIAQEGKYPEPETWSDLQRMEKTRECWIDINASDETIKLHEKLRGFKNRMKNPLSHNIIHLYDDFRELRTWWMDISEWNNNKFWKKLFIERIKIEILEYRRTGKKTHKAQRIQGTIITIRDEFRYKISLSDFPDYLSLRRGKVREMIRQYMRIWNKYHSFYEIEEEMNYLHRYSASSLELDKLYASSFSSHYSEQWECAT